MHTHLKALIEKFGRESVPELQILVLISLGFFRLFKWDELSNNEVQDIIFSTDHMIILWENAKVISLERVSGVLLPPLMAHTVL